MRLRLERIPEENQQVNRAIGDVGPYLDIPSEWPAFLQRDGQPRGIGEHFPGGSCGEQDMLVERTAIEFYPGKQVWLAGIMGDQGNALLLGQFYFVGHKTINSLCGSPRYLAPVEVTSTSSSNPR